MLPEAFQGLLHSALLWRSPGHCCLPHLQGTEVVGLVQGAGVSSSQAIHSAGPCNFNPCRAQKTSLWGWALGSVCTVVTECYEVVTLSNIQKKDESDEAWSARRLKAQTEINNRLVVLTHALVQVGPGGLAGEAARKQWQVWTLRRRSG